MSIDITGLVADAEAAGRKAFSDGLSTAWVPWKATWQGASTGESEMRDGWLRGWIDQAQAEADAAQAESQMDLDDDIDDSETGSLIWGQSVGHAYG